MYDLCDKYEPANSQNITRSKLLTSYRIVFMWGAVGLNLLVSLVAFLEATGKIDFLHFQDDCSAVNWLIAAWAYSLLPLLIAWMIPSSTIPTAHFFAVFIYFLMAIPEIFIALLGRGFCDFSMG
jgi:hypothetical protein